MDQRLCQWLSRLLWCGLYLTSLTATVRGEGWTSPDGVIKVTLPDEGFVRVENPPPSFLALSISSDETLRLGVAQMPYPMGQRLNRANFERGMVKAGGEITTSSTTEQNGHEVWVVSYTGSGNGGQVHGTQSIVRVNDSIYQIVAITSADAAVDQDIVQKYLQSLVVNGPHHPEGVAGPSGKLSSDEKFAKIYEALGGITVTVILVLLALWGLSYVTRKPRGPQSPLRDFLPR